MEINQWQFFAVSAIILTIFFKWIIDFGNRCKTLPTGPCGLPVLGYTPWLGKKPFEDFVVIAKKYGKMFSINLGNNTVVGLNDWESIKEALVNQPKAFSGRPYSFVHYSLAQGKDISDNNGPVWKTQRNLSMRILRNLGVGKKCMESRAMDVVHDVMDTLSRADGKLQYMESVFFGPILKTNWNIVSGSEEQPSHEVKKLEDLVSSIFEVLTVDNPVNTFPWLRFIPPNGFGHWENLRKNKLFLAYLKKVIDDHVVQWTEEKLDDFIDYYLAEINKHKTETGNEEDPFNALNLSIQKKAQDELDEVVGKHRLPNMNDMPRLQYLQALIMEIHRLASIVPFSVPHKTTETVKLLDYTIPKNTTVIQNIYAVHKDPELWDEPEVFKPERFLNATNMAKAPPYLMPFSIGPRICPGQSLAEMELSLMFSCLLHQFSFSLPRNRPLPSLEPVMSLVVKPHSYSLLINKRKE